MSSKFTLPPPPPPRPPPRAAAGANSNKPTTSSSSYGSAPPPAAPGSYGSGSYGATPSYGSSSYGTSTPSYSAQSPYAVSSPSSASEGAAATPPPPSPPAFSGNPQQLQYRYNAAAADDPLAAPQQNANSGGTYYGVGPSPPKPPPAFRPNLLQQSLTTGTAAGGGMAKPEKPSSLEKAGYQHSTVSAVGLGICTWIILTTNHHGSNNADSSAMLFQVFATLGLILYCLDLANFRQATLTLIWMSVCIFTVTMVWLVAGIPQVDSVLTIMIWVLTCGFFFATAIACRLTLAMEWLTSTGTMPRQLEAALHGLLPPLVAALLTDRTTDWIIAETSTATAEASTEEPALLAPYMFAVLLALGMMLVGACPSSFAPNNAAFTEKAKEEDSASDRNIASQQNQTFSIPSVVAFGHSALLLTGPLAIHLATCATRFISKNQTLDDWYDLVLVVLVPYLIHYVLALLHQRDSYYSPYGSASYSSRGLFSKYNAMTSTVIPLCAVVLTMFVLQQRYLIALSHAFSYRFLGTRDPAWLSTVYWCACTFFVLLCGSLWGRKSPSSPEEPLLGEFHDDIVQLCLAAAGLFFGKACGLPWNFTPLPILASLGLTLWIATRMLRYLAIFLFVLHATGIVVFTYRFAGIDHKLSLPIPGVQLSLLHFGLLVCFTSVVVGLVAGLAVRSTGGFGSTFIKKLDVPGLLLVIYSFLLLVLEITLVKRPVPTNELAGVEFHADEFEEEETLYERSTAIFTSVLLIMMAMAMKRVKLISDRSSGIAISLALGKAVSFYIDAGYEQDSDDDENSRAKIGFDILFRAVLASILCVVLFVPRVLCISPVHIKAMTRRRSLQTGFAGNLPKGTWGVIALYSFVFLPLALIVSVPYVLYPLASVIMEQYSDEYVSSSPILELLGTAIALWGLATMNTLNFYLPDGGAENLKKLSALVFLTGTGIFFAAPMLTPGLGGASSMVASNPYAAMSSLGRTLARRGRSRNGAWGLLSAALATLLAVAGPLELKERRSPTGRKDRMLLVRTMFFSLLFGSGVAWFIVMQNMREAPIPALVLVSIASLTVAFLGTIVGVMGLFLELSEFAELNQIALVWFVLTIIFLPFTWFTQYFLTEPVHWFGSGGWLSTYLIVVGLTSLCITLAFKNRFSKNQSTRGLSNFMCVLSWLTAISTIFGRYGVAGLDANFDVQLLLGLPACVIGTIVVSPILYLLEGDGAASKGTVTKLSAASNKAKKTPTGFFALSFPNLRPSNQWATPLFGTIFVFLAASLYAICVRGSGIFAILGVVGATVDVAATTATKPKETYVFLNNVKGAVKVAFEDLATLAHNSMVQDKALAATAKLAGAGFWTAEDMFGPLIHLGGVLSILPSLYLLWTRVWKNQYVSASTVIVALPLNAVPIVLCRGIPCLQAAAAIVVAAGTLQALGLRQADEESKMRI